jgi:2,4-dienoyl-CoA reductase-like NADH-dependent reductase (Old Yellow Enzyme family)
MRSVVGPGYAIMIKLGIKDYHPQGKTASEGVEQARLLEVDGVDAIEVSEGMEQDFFHHIRRDAVGPCYEAECREARGTLSLPLMLVGGLRRVEDMQRIVGDGVADAVSMCRPFIMEPQIVRRVRDSARASGCTSCNACLGQMAQGKLGCTLAGGAGN